MKRTFIGILSLAACLSSPMGLFALENVSMQVVPSIAPNGRSPYTSPGWSQYVNNATSALRQGLPSLGNPLTDPGAYQATGGTLLPIDMFYTNFASWDGMADPNPNFPALPTAFQLETGNNLQFGLHVQTDGSTLIRLRDLSWATDSNDLTNWFDHQGSFSTADYSPTRVGIHYGGDGIRGTTDDLVFKSGESGSLGVHELAYVGVGEGFFAAAFDSVNNQDAIIDNIRDLLTTAGNAAFDLSATYTLNVNGSPVSASHVVNISIPAGMGGDFDFDRAITSDDKDLLTRAIVAGTNDIFFDLNLNGEVNFPDLERMVKDIARTYFGDANCDGQFNSTDLVQVLVAGAYETGDPAVWSTGDFNADGIFDSGDFVLALQDGGYELGPVPPAIMAVPEPATIALTLIGLLLTVARTRRRSA